MSLIDLMSCPRLHASHLNSNREMAKCLPVKIRPQAYSSRKHGIIDPNVNPEGSATVWLCSCGAPSFPGCNRPVAGAVFMPVSGVKLPGACLVEWPVTWEALVASLSHSLQLDSFHKYQYLGLSQIILRYTSIQSTHFIFTHNWQLVLVVPEITPVKDTQGI